MNNKFLVAIRIWKCSQPNIFESLKWFCHATKYGNPQKAAGGLLVWQFYCPLYSIFWYTLYICCRVLACWAIVWLQISWTLIFDLGTKNHRFFRSYQWKIMSVENENRSNAAQLLSREPRVFISRPNVRGTLVAVEKAASHSVSLSTIITWGARSRLKRVWWSCCIQSSLFSISHHQWQYLLVIVYWFTLKSGPPPHPVL